MNSPCPHAAYGKREMVSSLFVDLVCGVPQMSVSAWDEAILLKFQEKEGRTLMVNDSERSKKNF